MLSGIRAVSGSIDRALAKGFDFVGLEWRFDLAIEIRKKGGLFAVM